MYPFARGFSVGLLKSDVESRQGAVLEVGAHKTMLRILTLLALTCLIGRAVWIGTRPKVDPPSDGPVVIELCVFGMPWENDLYTDIYIPEFERQNPNIKVRFHHFEDYGNRVKLSYAGDIAPDVIRQTSDGGPLWIRRGMNLALDKYIDGPDGIDRKDFFSQLWHPLTIDGKTYGVPQDINIVGLYYNKELFDKAGLSYPDATWTWDDLKNAAEKLTQDKDGDGHPEVVGFGMGWNDWGLRPLMYQAGGRYWSEDGKRVVFDSPETAEALRFMKSLMKRYTITQSNTQRGGIGPDTFFKQCKVAMYFDGSWITASIKKEVPNLRFGVAPLPRGKISMSVSGSCFWGVSSKTRHPEEAWKLVKYLSSTEALVKYWQVLWVAPPARWSALRDARFRDVTGVEERIPGLPTQEEFNEKCGWIPQVLENGWTTLEMSNQYLDRASLHLREAVDRVLLENANPERALREAARKANKQIRQAEEADLP